LNVALIHIDTTQKLALFCEFGLSEAIGKSFVRVLLSYFLYLGDCCAHASEFHSVAH